MCHKHNCMAIQTFTIFEEEKKHTNCSLRHEKFNEIAFKGISSGSQFYLVFIVHATLITYTGSAIETV